METAWEWIVKVFLKIWSFISEEPTSTIVAGVVVFIVGEWLKEIWLSPLQEYKSLKAKTARMLVQYANLYSNTANLTKGNNEHYDKASDEMRILASELSAFAETMHFIHIGIPKAKDIAEASRCIIGISNSFYITNNETLHDRIEQVHKYRDDVKRYLKLHEIPK